MTEGWSLGILVGLPVGIILFLLCLVVAGFAWFIMDDGGTMSIALFGGIVVLAITGFALWPWVPSYHYWKPYSGVVQSTQGRLLSSDGKTTEEVFSVLFTDGQERKCDDTRCATVHPGDILTLVCKPEYQFFGTPGYSCNWGKVERKNP